MEKQGIVTRLLKQLLRIIWKLFLMLVLVVGRVIVMLVSIMNSQIEDYLRVPKKNL